MSTNVTTKSKVFSDTLQLYRTLTDMKLDWSKVTTCKLGEYIGLPRISRPPARTTMRPSAEATAPT